LSDAIRLQGGVIDKYIGDAIMAYWGPPFTSPDDHAVRACHAALDQLTRFREFAAALPEIIGVHGLPPVGLRIGIASGDVVVGSIGSEFARGYTLIGDRVNLAARIEKVTRLYDVPILISERTAMLAAEAIETREIDTIQVRGKAEPQRVFELLGRRRAGLAHRLWRGARGLSRGDLGGGARSLYRLPRAARRGRTEQAFPRPHRPARGPRAERRVGRYLARRARFGALTAPGCRAPQAACSRRLLAPSSRAALLPAGPRQSDLNRRKSSCSVA
jgi:hypothetical protein